MEVAKLGKRGAYGYNGKPDNQLADAHDFCDINRCMDKQMRPYYKRPKSYDNQYDVLLYAVVRYPDEFFKFQTFLFNGLRISNGSAVYVKV